MDRYVAVVGPGDGATEVETRLAEEVGRRLAGAGVVVITGGLGGVMAAAARGARDAGGRTIGVLPGLDRRVAAPDVELVISSGLGEFRNGVLVNSADGLVAVGGSWGTLSEIALARRAAKPVVSLRGWAVWDADGIPVPSMSTDSAAQAVDLLLEQLG